MTRPRLLLIALLLLINDAVATNDCPASGLALMPVVKNTQDPAASYLVFLDGTPRAAINVGPGSADTLQQYPTLEAVFFTALHTEQTSDLPALVESWKRRNHRPVTVYGPTGSRTMPSTTTFVRTLFDGTRGAFRYLGAVVNPLARDGFRLHAHDVLARRPRLRRGPKEIGPAAIIWSSGNLEIHNASTGNTELPSLAFRVETKTQSIVVLDVARDNNDDVVELSTGAGLVVAQVQTRKPDGPYFTDATLARTLKGSRVRELAFNGPGDVNALVLEKALAGPAVSLQTKRCWTPIETGQS